MAERSGPLWLASIAAVVVVAVMGVMSLDLDGRELRDTDGYMRTVRVGELVAGDRGWGDPVVGRANAPFGHDLHWTIPMDAVLVGASTMFRPFVDPVDAVYGASVVASPLLQLGLLLVVAWAARPLVGPVGAPVAGLVAAVQPTVLSYFGAGRSDHHSLIALAAAGLLGGLIRSETGSRRRAAILGGLAGGIGLWTSPEFLFPLLLVGVWGVWAWWRGGPSVDSHRDLWLTAAAVTWVGLVAERGFDGVGVVEYDRISVVHAALVSGAALWWTLVHTERVGRTIGVVAGGVVGAVLLVAFPGLVSGPFSDVPGELRSAWLDRVSELGPIFRGGATPGDVAVMAWPLAAVPLGWWLRGRAEGSMAWTAVVGWVGAGLVASVLSARFSIYPQLAAGVVFGGVFAVLETPLRSAWRPVVLAAVAFGWVGVIPVAGMVTAEPAPGGSGGCDLGTAASSVDARLGPGDIVLAGVDDGPELLHRTDASVIGTPYHRNPGILWTFDVFEAEAVRAVDEIRGRGVDLVMVCPAVDGKDYPDAGTDSLFARLRVAHPPTGVAYEESTGGFLVFSVSGT